MSKQIHWNNSEGGFSMSLSNVSISFKKSKHTDSFKGCHAPKVVKTCGYIRIGNEETAIRWLVDLRVKCSDLAAKSR